MSVFNSCQLSVRSAQVFFFLILVCLLVEGQEVFGYLWRFFNVSDLIKYIVVWSQDSWDTNPECTPPYPTDMINKGIEITTTTNMYIFLYNLVRCYYPKLRKVC